MIGASGTQHIVHKSDNELSSYELPNAWDGLGVKQTHINLMQAGVIEVKQSNGLITKYGYDDFGRIVYIGNPSTGRNYYAYDEQDQLVGIKLASGVQITYQYDQKGRRIHKSTKQNNKIVEEVSWKYNANDQLISAKESHQTTEYKYNEQGRVTEKRIILEGLPKPLVTHFSYDKNDSISRIILPDGIELLSEDKGIRYKAPNEFKARIILKENEIQNGQNHNVSYQLGQHIVMGHYYDNNGQFAGLSYRTLPKSGSNPFIKSAQASTPNFSPLFSQQWSRTDEGIVDQVTEVDYQGKPIEHNYLYDSQYHLISSSYQPIKLDSDFKPVTTDKDTDTVTGKEVYQARYLYDELGNRILADEQSQSLNKYQYNDKGLLTQVTPLAQAVKGDLNSVKNIAYNEAGLPTQYGNYRLEYTAGQVTTIKDSKDKLIAEYTYNDLGQRIKKRVYQEDKKQLASPKTTYYVYEDSQLQHELDGDGNIIRHYVYIGDTLTATIDYPSYEHGQALRPEQSGISVWQRSKNWMSKLWGQEDAYPKVNYVITDYLGRPRQVRDGESNALKWQFMPTAFGGKVDDSLSTEATGSAYELNIRFPGQYEDSETGLYYNHWRYYDQNTGRYISSDPLGLGGDENLYAYVNAAPTHFIDPPGLLLFAFDGTGNQDYGKGTSFSNVVKFRDAYRADPNEPTFPNTLWTGQGKKFGNFANNNAFYISGPGTTDQYSKTRGFLKDLATGETMIKRVDLMISYLHDYLERVDKEYKNKKVPMTINLDVVGFSRGAAEARMFASRVRDLMYGDVNNTPRYEKIKTSRGGSRITWNENAKWLYNKDWLKKNCSINFNFNFLGLWDTVPSYATNDDISLDGVNVLNDGIQLKNKGYALTVDREWNRVAHAVAVNENRSGFPVRSIFNAGDNKNSSNRLERGFLGAHSDIGGGYAEGDLSDVALMWVINQARKAGINFQVPTRYTKVTNPIVHDSVKDSIGFTPSREFLWAEQNSHGPRQYVTQKHLILNWANTLKFQARDQTKFQQIKEISEALPKAKSCSANQLVCIPVGKKSKQQLIKEYSKLKTEETILYNSSKQKIDIDGYIKWLKDNGYALGSNSNMLDY